MKSIQINTILIIILTAITISCSKEWLETEPQGVYLEGNFYQNDEQVLQGLAAAYAHLRIQMLNESQFGQDYCSANFLLNMPSDEANVGGQFLGDWITLEEVGHFTLTSENRPIYYRWFSDFNGINRCNLVINNPEYESEILTIMQGEARFLRAYYYFELVRMFGPVPLITSTLAPTEYEQTNSSLEELFNQMEEDLLMAIEVLPRKSEWEYASRNRASIGAAQALLGKVYLFMASPYYNFGSEYYNEAAEILEDLIALGEYELEPSYGDIWTLSHEHGIESIFEIEFSSVSNREGWWNGLQASGSVDCQMSGPRLNLPSTVYASGWGFCIPSQSLINAYTAAGDSARRSSTCLFVSEIQESGGTVTDFPQTFANAYNKKHTTRLSEQSADNARWGWPVNERILRYADVLLMAAEVHNRKNSPDDSKALEYVNQVRERAKLDPVSFTGNELFTAIQNERRLELALEGHRFHDLVRWGIAAETINAYRESDNLQTVLSIFIKGKHEVFPIPAIEIVNSGFQLNQNPNY
ncbi:SusD-like protein P2 [subsurface metagenome]